jgi:hypothetical protein
MKKNTAIMTGLFVLLMLTFTINPKIFYQLQDNLLGKIIIVSTLIYLTINSVTLGLLFTLILIILFHRSNNYTLIEGVRNRRIKPKITKRKNTATQAKLKAARAKARAAKLEAEAKAKAAQAEAKAAQAEAEVADIQELDAIDTSNFAEFEDIVDMDMGLTENFENGIDRLAIEDTFRVKNPSTIPTNKEQFSIMGNIMPFDNNMQLFGGMSSFV